MKEKIRACYERLQTLSITSTKGNMEALLKTMYELQEVYLKLEGRENAGAEARTADHSE